MLSVLIPVYNYDVIALVNELHKQLLDSNIAFEIRCLDDRSTSEFALNNKVVNDLSYVSYVISQENNGREVTRQELANAALYDNLLFLDADTMPCDSSFITNYLEQISDNYKAIFGGIIYEIETPSPDLLLRWKYGRSNETKSAEERNKLPYRSITSPNFLIDKNTFVRYNSKIKRKDYGFDVYFAALLKGDKVAVHHIDNMVYHLGIENSDVYLDKSEYAIKTYHLLYTEGKITASDNGLLSLFIKLKRIKLNYLLSFIFRHFKNLIAKHLKGTNPSIKLFQLYRLSFLCNYDLQESKQNQLESE